MEITEKVAYLKGLMEGMKIDTESNEGKVLAAMADILEDIGLELEDLWNAQGELEDGLDVVSDDLEDVEDTVYGEDEDDESFDDEYYEDDADEDEDCYATTCPTCDLLILDDLGTEMTTAFVQSALYQIINGRLLEKRSTIVSTNLMPEALAQRYSPQIASRIEGEYQLLPFVGEDIRTLKKKRGL